MSTRVGQLPEDHGMLRVVRGRVVLVGHEHAPASQVQPREREALRLAIQMQHGTRIRRIRAWRVAIVAVGLCCAVYLMSQRLRPALTGGWEDWAILGLWSSAALVATVGALRLVSLIARRQ